MKPLQSCFTKTAMTGSLFPQRLPEEKIMVTWIHLGVTHFRNKGTVKWEQSGQERGSANINCCTKLFRQAWRLTMTTVGSEKYCDKPVRIIQNLTIGKAAMRSVLQAVMMVQHTKSPWEVSMVRAPKVCPLSGIMNRTTMEQLLDILTVNKKLL